jgi:4'-phosphopantetheinyl transferase
MPILYKSEFLNQDVFIWELIETEEQLQHLIPDEPKPDFSYAPRRATWMGTRCLLREIYKSSPIISYNQHGKPSLNNSDEISISHSGNLIAFARSKVNCGIDIQLHSDKIGNILPKFLNEHEVVWLAEKSNKTPYHHLIWCAKEAIFKVFGFEVDFKKEITILNFNALKKGTFKALVKRNEIEKMFTLEYSIVGDYFLVFTHE